MLRKYLIIIFLNNDSHGLTEVIDVPLLYLLNIVAAQHRRILDLTSLVERFQLLYFLNFKGFHYEAFLFLDSWHWLLARQRLHIVRYLLLSNDLYRAFRHINFPLDFKHATLVK